MMTTVVKYFLSLLMFTLSFVIQAQEFRGIVSTKVYAEKGEVRVLAPFKEELDEGIISEAVLQTREVDTVYHEYYVCSDTVFHLKKYDSESLVAESAQIGPDFYLASVDYNEVESYFKFRAPPSQLEKANNGKWKRPKRRFRKQGYNGFWEMPLNPLYYFQTVLDTSVSFGWLNHEQGLLNHIFPVNGVHRKVREGRKDAVWIHEYSYELIESLSCDSLYGTFQLKDDEVVNIDSLFRGGVIDKDIIPQEERKPFKPFDAVDKYDIPVIQREPNGSLTYIDFWASWCKPCLMEMPYLSKLSEHYSDSDVRVVSISIDTEEQALSWRKVMDRYKIDWDSWRVNGGFDCQLCQEYDIGAIPRYILLDRDGKVMNANAPRPSNPSIIEWLDEQIIED